MDLLVFSWIDYMLFSSTFVLSGAVGLYYGCVKKQETTKDYLLGGKKMNFFPVAISLVASTLSGVSLLGIPAEVYVYGTQCWLMIVSFFILGFLINYIYLPVFYDLQLTSVFEYLELRFHKSVRKMASLIFILNSLFFLPVIIYAPSLAFNQVTGFNLQFTAISTSVICIFYTTIGGLKAVVWTDTLQFLVTLCTLLFILVMGTISTGGLCAIWEKAELGSRIEFFNMNLDPTVRITFWNAVIGYLFIWTSFVAINPPTVQRFLSVPTLKDSKRALMIYLFFTIITKSISCFLGLIIYAKYFDCDPLSVGLIKRGDQILPYYVLDVAAQIPGLSGIFVAGLFTTTLSTLSTYLNTLSGLLYVDFVSLLMPSDTTELKASNVMKIMTAGIGLISLALVYVVERLGSILEVFVGLSGITGGPFVGLFTIGLIFPFVNRKGAIYGTLTSLSIMSFIIIKTQIHIWNYNIHYVPKPFNTYGCNTTSYQNETFISTTFSTIEESTENPFWLFKISFLYYNFMGTFLTLIFGTLISVFTKKSSDPPVSPSVVSPFIRRFLKKSVKNAKYASVDTALQTLGVVENTEEDQELNKSSAFSKINLDYTL